MNVSKKEILLLQFLTDNDISGDEAILTVKKHVCPVCHGLGAIDNNDGYGIEYDSAQCDSCDGFGYIFPDMGSL